MGPCVEGSVGAGAAGATAVVAVGGRRVGAKVGVTGLVAGVRDEVTVVVGGGIVAACAGTRVVGVVGLAGVVEAGAQPAVETKMETARVTAMVFHLSGIFFTSAGRTTRPTALTRRVAGLPLRYNG